MCVSSRNTYSLGLISEVDNNIISRIVRDYAGVHTPLYTRVVVVVVVVNLVISVIGSLSIGWCYTVTPYSFQ